MLEYDLWKKISEHDDRISFDRFYLIFWEKLYGIAWNRTQDHSVAKDLVQEVFINVWEKRKHIKINGPVSNYLAGALKYRLIDHFQSERTKKAVFEQAYLMMETVADRHDVDLSYEEVETILADELRKMPRNMSESFALRMDRQSVREIADKLNLAEQTVSNLLTEATKRLKRNLPRRFEKHNTLFIVAFIRIVENFLTQN